MKKTTSQRLLTLDALRGVCAILVVADHGSDVNFSPFPGAYLAVDFFFILSGLVVGRAYASRLRQGLSFRDFVKARLIRLYPLFALGLLIDAARAVANVYRGRAGDFDLSSIATTTVRGLLMLPSEPRWIMLFRLNSPVWSLACDMVMNVLFAVVLFRLRSAVLAALAAGGFVMLALAAHSHGSYSMGSMWSTAMPGMLRAWWGFIVGMLIARVPLVAPRASWTSMAVVGVMVALMATRLPDVWLETLCVGLGLPMLVYAGACLDPPAALARTAAAMGRISYPIYALHWPLVYLLRTMGRALEWPAPVTLGFSVAVIVAFAWGVGRYLDEPVRRMLARRPASHHPVARATID